MFTREHDWYHHCGRAGRKAGWAEKEDDCEVTSKSLAHPKGKALKSYPELVLEARLLYLPIS